jgi:hypothetical protein
MKLKPTIVSIAAIAALSVSGTAAAGGSGHVRFKTVRAHIQPTDLVSTAITPVCDAGGTCVYTSTTTATQTGDLVGSTVEADAGGFVDTAFHQTVLGTFTGDFEGCGSGTFLYSGQRTIDAGGDIAATYVVVAGSGTGDLAGISGRMTQHDTTSSAAAAPIEGVFRCAVH